MMLHQMITNNRENKTVKLFLVDIPLLFNIVAYTKPIICECIWNVIKWKNKQKRNT